MNLFNTPDWSYIITVVSIFLSIWSLLLSFKFPVEIDLSLVSWKNILRKVGGKQELNCLTLFFQNAGKKVIYKNDLPDKIKIQMFNIGIIDEVIVETNCKYNQVYQITSGDTVGFDFDFLEPNKYIKISILHSNMVKDARVYGKVIGGDELDHRIETNARWHEYFVGKKEADAKIFIFPLFTVSTFLVQANIAKQMFQLKDGIIFSEILKFNKSSFIILLISFILVVTSISIGLWVKNLFIPFAVFARKEKNWYRKMN